MPSPHVTTGTRIYVPSIKTYGDVVRTSILGTEAIVIQCDDGSMKAFCGEAMVSDVVNKSTGKNGKGEDVVVPTDVKVIGPAVLESIGLDETTRTALFQKFMVLDTDLRLEKATYWEANKDDEAAMSKFLPELMTVLGEDTLYIQTQANKLLAHLGADVRAGMLTKFMESTTEEERKVLIIEYTSKRSDKIKTEEFLQNMYELLLNNTEYITMEFKEALALNKIYEPESTELVATYLENTSESTLESVVNRWRTLKYYRSNKGRNYAHNQVRKYA